MSTYGRNRQSRTDIEEELTDIFKSLSEGSLNDAGEPVLPAKGLVDVLRIYGERHGGVRLLEENAEDKLREIVQNMPGIELTPQVVVSLVVNLTEHTPGNSPSHDSEHSDDNGVDDESGSNHSHSSHSSGHDRPSALPPKTPVSAHFSNSPFDSGRRQRTIPLQHAAPSSWNARKPQPSSRRRSDAGSYGRPTSDTESSSPSHTKRSGSRSRPPSNPASPYGSHTELWQSTSSPSFIGSPPMRPHSRAQSHGQFSSVNYGYSSPGQLFDNNSPPGRDRLHNGASYDDDSFERSLNSISMPKLDPDSDGEGDPTLGLIMPNRSAASSMASLASQELLDSARKETEELRRRLTEQDRSYQLSLADSENTIVSLENTIEEYRSELSGMRREEKELRSKETRYSHQISALESEVAKMQRALDTAKASYQSLQKQYQEQCMESENLRRTLRTREEEIRDNKELSSLHDLEIRKWQQQYEQLVEQNQFLQAQLETNSEAQAQLEVQKQENLLLKETIDRMRFEMDEMRSKADFGGTTGSSSGPTSTQNSISKSLGSEIMRVNEGSWLDDGGSGDDESTAVSDGEGHDSGDTEGEDVVQTIITHRKKKVASRAMRKTETIRLESTKEYSDAYTQHDASGFVTSCSIQTEPEPKRVMLSFSTQTEDTPVNSSESQTEPVVIAPPVLKAEMEIQTDITEDARASSIPDEEMTSSSSTIYPPTPKSAPQILKNDLPPSYAQVADENDDDAQTQRDVRVASEAIRKWHTGLHLPLAPVRGGVSEDAIEEWTALKEEIGFDCVAIDKVLEMSLKTGQPRDVPRGEGPSTAGPTGPSERRFQRKNRFYNIYNTFVYGQPDKNADHSSSAPAGPASAFTSNLTQACVIFGVFAIAASVITAPYTHPQYNVPGGPTYYDRAAWSEFNRLYPTGEGLGQDGAATVWDFIGRIGGEAARMARGWPS